MAAAIGLGAWDKATRSLQYNLSGVTYKGTKAIAGGLGLKPCDGCPLFTVNGTYQEGGKTMLGISMSGSF